MLGIESNLYFSAGIVCVTLVVRYFVLNLVLDAGMVGEVQSIGVGDTLTTCFAIVREADIVSINSKSRL